MKNSEFYTLMDRIFNDARAIAKSKGEDYTKGSDDALANFKEGGEDINIDPIKVCWIFMNKHYQAITNYVKTNGQSESEPISERIKDAINYLVLMQAIIVEKEQNTMKIVEPISNAEPIPNILAPNGTGSGKVVNDNNF